MASRTSTLQGDAVHRQEAILGSKFMGFDVIRWPADRLPESMIERWRRLERPASLDESSRWVVEQSAGRWGARRADPKVARRGDQTSSK